MEQRLVQHTCFCKNPKSIGPDFLMNFSAVQLIGSTSQSVCFVCVLNVFFGEQLMGNVGKICLKKHGG